MRTKILLCEDEPRIARFIQQGLSEDGHTVTWVSRGKEAIRMALEEPFDVLLLDIRLPDLSGLEVCHEIRRYKPLLPILMLTALDAVEDRVAGLRAGADDYLPKPFAFDELLARIEALHRRSQQQGGGILAAGDFEVNPYTKTCHYQGKAVTLTPREFDLFAFFMARPSQVLPRETIYREVWQMPFEPNTNVVEVYIRYLRKALAAADCPDPIEAVRGVGYRFIVPNQATDTSDHA